jgi:hypothetical protein
LDLTSKSSASSAPRGIFSPPVSLPVLAQPAASPNIISHVRIIFFIFIFFITRTFIPYPA